VPVIPQPSPFTLVGGGRSTQPGKISLAHHGVLFLGEFPESPKNVLESLHQPLEDRIITITKVSAKVTYPAHFMLVGYDEPLGVILVTSDKKLFM